MIRLAIAIHDVYNMQLRNMCVCDVSEKQLVIYS